MENISYIDSLICKQCGQSYDCDQVQTFCPHCQAPLFAVYDLTSAKANLDRAELSMRPKGMWRWKEFLPVHDQSNIVTLGEGDTPLLKPRRIGQSIGLKNLFIKDESLNPTGSFKARGLSAAVSKAKELGVRKMIIPTAGNAGGALAAYAASAGLQASILMPKDTPKTNVTESLITGAEVTMVDGLISDAAVLAREKAVQEGWFDVSTFKEPYRTEGKKIMGYELAEQFNWSLPDVIIYPTGGGTGLVGMWKAFDELEALGWLDNNKRPRLVSVQAKGCAPIVKAFQDGALTSSFWTGAATIASGLRVPKSFADKEILADLKKSNGTAISVSDEDIILAQKKLAVNEGIFAAPEGAATFAALEILVQDHFVSEDETIVLFNTGAGLKYSD